MLFARSGDPIGGDHTIRPMHNPLGLRLVTTPVTPVVEGLETPGPRQLAAEDVRREVCAGIADANASLGTHFAADLVRFVPSDTGPAGFHRGLARAAVCRSAAEQRGPRHVA